MSTNFCCCCQTKLQIKMSRIEKEKLWYYTQNDIVEDGFEQLADNIYVYRLPIQMFRKGARCFSDIADNSWSQGMYEGWIFFCQAIQQLSLMRRTTSVGGGSSLDSSLQPSISVFLETVQADASSHSGSSVIYRHPSQFQQLDGADVQSSEQLLAFLPDIPGVAVCEYRFWLCISSLNLLKAFIEVIENAAAFSGEGSRNGRRLCTPASINSRGRSKLQPYELWKKIHSGELLTLWLDNYMGVKRLSRPEFIERAKLPSLMCEGSGSTMPLDSSHPLHPDNTFNVVFALSRFVQETPPCEQQSNMANYGTHNGKLRFPKPKNVLKLNLSDVKPEFVYDKCLPDYQKALIFADECSVKTGSRKRRTAAPVFVTRLSQPANGLSDYLEAHHVNQEYADGLLCEQSDCDLESFISDSLTGNTLPFHRPSAQSEGVETVRNALTIIREQSLKDLPIIQQKRQESRESFRSSYLEHQAWVFDDFEKHVLHNSATAGLSQAGLSIVNAITDSELFDNFDHFKLIVYDNKLDLFGNLVICRMEAFEQFLFVYAAHRQFLIFSIGTLDAFRHAYNLHFSAFAIGKSATSKSFLFEVLEKCSNPGIIQVISYQSLKADASDLNQNDTITILNEFSLKSVDANERARGNVTTPEALMKDKATSCKTVGKVLEFDADGNRHTRITLGESIGCWLAASNDDPSCVSESFWSRYHWAMFQLIDRSGRNMVDLTDAEARLSGANVAKLQNYLTYMKQLQALHWLVEKLIMTGGLTDVSLTATNTVITHVNAYLLKHQIHVHSRVFERMRILARLFTIHLALHYLYAVPIKILNLEGTAMVDNFYGKPFELQQLKYIDPYLRDEESIAYFVLGLLKDQIVDPIEDIMRKELRRLHDNTSDIKLRYLCIGTVGRDVSDGDDDVTIIDQPTNNTSESKEHPNSSNDVIRCAIKSMDAKQRRRAMEENITKKFEEVYDYSYLRICERMEKIPTHIESHYCSASKPSVYQFKATWKHMCERSSLVHVYNCSPQGEAHFPVRDETAEKVYQPLVKVVNDRVYVHAALLDTAESDRDILDEAIRSTFHRYTRARKILYGEQHSTKYPNLFKVLHVKPVDKTLTTCNVLYMNAEAKLMLSTFDGSSLCSVMNSDSVQQDCRDIPMSVLNVQLDRYSCQKRLEILGLPTSSQHIVAIHPTKIMRMTESAALCHTKNYPDCYIKNQEEQEERTKRLMRLANTSAIQKLMPSALVYNSASQREADEKMQLEGISLGIDDVDEILGETQRKITKKGRKRKSKTCKNGVKRSKTNEHGYGYSNNDDPDSLSQCTGDIPVSIGM